MAEGEGHLELQQRPPSCRRRPQHLNRRRVEQRTDIHASIFVFEPAEIASPPVEIGADMRKVKPSRLPGSAINGITDAVQRLLDILAAVGLTQRGFADPEAA
jgi:hypothetical protein